MPRYDGLRYDPPAPVAVVKLQSFAADRSIPDVQLLIDTGADITLLPSEAVSRLGVQPQPEARPANRLAEIKRRNRRPPKAG